MICSHKPTIKFVNKEKVKTYGKLDADSLWWIMKELRTIRKKLDEGLITDEKEVELLERLLKTKSWNPYCIRHSAITDDNANLKGDIAAKVGWTPNTKQRNRYVKSKMGNDMKKNILERDGIFLDDNENIIPSSKICYRCNFINGFDYQVCQKCGYPISQEALNRIKEEDNRKFNEITNKLALSDFKREIDNIMTNSKAVANEIIAKDGSGELKKVEWAKGEQLRYFISQMKKIGEDITEDQINYIKEYLERSEPVELYRVGFPEIEKERIKLEEQDKHKFEEKYKQMGLKQQEKFKEKFPQFKGKSDKEITQELRRIGEKEYTKRVNEIEKQLLVLYVEDDLVKDKQKKEKK